MLSFIPLTLLAQVIYSEDFDDLAPGTLISESNPVHWRTWSDLPGSPEDAAVTDSMARSGPNSLYFIQEILNIAGGPVDQLLMLGDRVYGSYVLQWSMYVAEGHGAFIVVYHGSDFPSADPAAVLWFQPYNSDTATCFANGMEFKRRFPKGSWFTVSLGFNLDEGTASFFLDGVLVGSWPFATMPSGTSSDNLLSAVRFTASSGALYITGEYYIDDILFQEGSVGIAEVEAHRSLSIFPNPTSGGAALSVERPMSNAQLEAHDASGRVVLRMPWAAGQTKLSLPAGALAPGAYVVRVASASRASATSATSAETPVYSGRLVVIP